jgi:hypothetical protein
MFGQGAQGPQVDNESRCGKLCKKDVDRQPTPEDKRVLCAGLLRESVGSQQRREDRSMYCAEQLWESLIVSIAGKCREPAET